jgi:hypothetical protein
MKNDTTKATPETSKDTIDKNWKKLEYPSKQKIFCSIRIKRYRY